MNKLIFLLCLLLAGCATTRKDTSDYFQPAKIAPPVSMDKEELADIIAVFSKEIKANPGHAGAYYNRAVAYFHDGNYEASWKDVRKAEELGMRGDPVLLDLAARLRETSGKGK